MNRLLTLLRVLDMLVDRLYMYVGWYENGWRIPGPRLAIVYPGERDGSKKYTNSDWVKENNLGNRLPSR